MPDYKRYESLETWISWQYFKDTLNWPIRRIAYELDLNEQRLLENVGKLAATMTRMADSHPEQVKKIFASLKEKYPFSQPAEREVPNLNIQKVAKAYTEGFSLMELSEKFKTKHDDFIFWWNQKLKLINEEIRKINAASNVIV